MTTTFERYKVQTYIEQKLGCGDLSQWNAYRDTIPNIKLSSHDQIEIKDRLNQDVKDLYFKGCYSLLRGLADVESGHFSWAIIKFYYSIFYSLRSSLGSKNLAFIKCKCPFLLEVKTGESPVKKSGSRYRNDHSAIISVWTEEINEKDILLTNNIEETNAYTWMQELRNKIQYRKASFSEPLADESLVNLADRDLSFWIETFLDDIEHIFCFDPDFAAVALPLKRSLFSSKDLLHASIELEDDQKQYLRTIAPTASIYAEVLDELNL